MYTISSPLYIFKNKRLDKWYIHLNNALSLQGRVYNTYKVRYSDQMSDTVSELPVFDKVRLIFTFYPGTKRRCDLSNMCSIIDKFICDVLVRSGKIPDDDYHHIPSIHYEFGSLDRENPRVDIQIIPIKEEEC
jgi:hypothetical protein